MQENLSTLEGDEQENEQAEMSFYQTNQNN